MRLWGKRYCGYSHYWTCKSRRSSDPHHKRFCAGEWFCIPYTKAAATTLQIHNLKALICALSHNLEPRLRGTGRFAVGVGFCSDPAQLLWRVDFWEVTWDNSLDAVCPSEFLSWAQDWMRCCTCGMRCCETQGLALSSWPLCCPTQ